LTDDEKKVVESFILASCLDNNEYIFRVH
jgi:hypothetical protein